MTKSGIIHKGWVWQSIALAAIGLYIIVFTAFTIERHNTFNSAAYDLGIYDNILWKMSRGDLLGFLRPGFVGGAHIDLILILLVPLRWVWPDVRGLLFIQSFALGIAGLAVYRIAVRAWQRPWAGAFFTVMYLLYVPVGWVNKFDFHPIALAAPLLFFAFDAGEARRYHRTSGLLFLAMLCKEEMGLVVASMGLFFFLKERWRAGLAWTVIGILWFAAGFVAINLLGVADVNRYSWLFQGTLSDRIAFFFQDIQHRLLFILELLIPFFFTPLLCLQVLAIALPILIAHLLSAALAQSSIFYHYTANILPFFVIAAIQGTYKVWQWAERRKRFLRSLTIQRALLTIILVASIFTFSLFNPFTRPQPLYRENGPNVAGLRAAAAYIGPDECLITTNNVGSHYAQRSEIYLLNFGPSHCSTVLVDLHNTELHEYGEPREYTCSFFYTRNYSPVFYEGDVFILRKNAEPDPVGLERLTEICRTNQVF